MEGTVGERGEIYVGLQFAMVFLVIIAPAFQVSLSRSLALSLSHVHAACIDNNNYSCMSLSHQHVFSHIYSTIHTNTHVHHYHVKTFLLQICTIIITLFAFH